MRRLPLYSAVWFLVSAALLLVDFAAAPHRLAGGRSRPDSARRRSVVADKAPL